MIRTHRKSIIAAAIFAALSTAAVAQTRQSTDASQAAQTNPEQYVNPGAATGVASGARVRGDDDRVRMGTNATTNQSTTASQNTNSAQGTSIGSSRNGRGATSSLPGMGAVPGVSGGVIGGASASAGGTSASAGGAVDSTVDVSDGTGKHGRGNAKGHRTAPGMNR
jgi:hypothetical protein